ncbi:MAG: AsmA family protein [Halioglobus sp.]
MGLASLLKLVTGIVLLAVLLVAGLIGYVQFADLNWLKPHIESVVAERGDFELSLAGDIDLDLFPDPAILVEDATFNGEIPGAGTLSLSLGHLSGRVKMQSLRNRPLRLVDIHVRDLVLDRTPGTANPSSSPEESNTGSGLAVLVESAELTAIQLRNHSPSSEAFALLLDTLSVRQQATNQLTLAVRIAGDADAQGSASGPPLEGPPVELGLSLGAQVTDDTLVLEDIDLKVAESSISGELTISTGDRLQISGSLVSPHIDLTPLARPDADAQEAGSDSPGSQGAASRYVFEDTALRLERLKAADIDLRLRNQHLRFETFSLIDVATDITLQAGELHLSNQFEGSEGGRASSRMHINAASQPALLQADIKGRDLKLNLISGDISDPSRIPPLDLTVDLQAQGNTPRALAASSNGRVLVTLRDGQIANNSVGLFIGDFVAQVFGKLNPFAQQEENTWLDCLVLGMNIDDGIVDFGGMLLQTEKVKAVGDGGIDLDTEELEVEFESRPREGLGISASMFVTPFIGLDGTLAEPKIKMNKTSAIVAVATGGLSLLAKTITGRAEGRADTCQELIEHTGGHPPIK